MKLVGRRGLFSIPGRSIYAASAILRVLLFRIRVALFEQRFTNEKLVDLVLASRDIGPIQLRSELIAMLDAVRRQKPKTVLEIGTAHGGTLFLLCLASDKNGTILSIDLPGGEFGGGYPVWKTPLYRAFGRIGQRIHLLRANSHAQETSLKIQAILAGLMQPGDLFKGLPHLTITGVPPKDGVLTSVMSSPLPYLPTAVAVMGICSTIASVKAEPGFSRVDTQ